MSEAQPKTAEEFLLRWGEEQIEPVLRELAEMTGYRLLVERFMAEIAPMIEALDAQGAQ